MRAVEVAEAVPELRPEGARPVRLFGIGFPLLDAKPGVDE